MTDKEAIKQALAAVLTAKAVVLARRGEQRKHNGHAEQTCTSEFNTHIIVHSLWQPLFDWTPKDQKQGAEELVNGGYKHISYKRLRRMDTEKVPIIKTWLRREGMQ